MSEFEIDDEDVLSEELDERAEDVLDGDYVTFEEHAEKGGSGEETKAASLYQGLRDALAERAGERSELSKNAKEVGKRLSELPD